MKGAVSLIVFIILSLGLCGCYTVLVESSEPSTDYVQTEPVEIVEPIWQPRPPIIRPPVQPKPINPIIVIIDPIVIEPPRERLKIDRRPSNGDRDPLRGHGNRGNGERTSEIVKRDGNNSGSRR
jgi:hypothetical protein